MIPVLMVWLYFALLFTVMQWPNKIAMLSSFVLLAGPPLFMLYRIFLAKRGNSSSAGSMQGGMGEENNQHTKDDQ